MLYSQLIYNLIKPEWKVLDVGGWAQPFQRANKVIDVQPYDTRQISNIAVNRSIGQQYTKDDWLQIDLVKEKNWKFTDKEFDFVLSGHTLEDLSNPKNAIEEIFRVGKRIAIEVPSRFYEQTNGIDPTIPHLTGADHHHWILDLDVKLEELRFFKKDNEILKDPSCRLLLPNQNVRLQNSKKLNQYGNSLFFFTKKPKIKFIEKKSELVKFYQETIKKEKNSDIWTWKNETITSINFDPFKKSMYSIDTLLK